MTFAALITKWEELILPTHKPSTQASEGVHLRRLRAEFGELDLSSVDLEKIQRWVTTSPAIGGKSPGYIRNLVATMRQVWESGQGWGYIPEEKRSPFEKLKLPRRWIIEQPCLAPEQAKTLIRAAREPYATMLWLVSETGIRVGELVALQIGAVNTVTKMVSIKRSAWRSRHIGTPKTKKGFRVIDISEDLSRHIQKYRATLAHQLADDLLFPNPHNRPYNSSNLTTRHLRPLLTAIGITGEMGFHAFRHGSASIMADWGVNEKARQDRLGHTNFEVTRGYTHADKGYHRELADKLGRVFNPF